MAPAYLFGAPNGVPGDISRPDNCNVEPAMLVGVGDPAVYPTTFGIPVKYVTGGIQQFNGGAETPDLFAGVLIREAPSISGSTTPASEALLDGGVPNPAQPQGLLVRGYVSVICARGTPARGGAVFIQIVANGGVPVGAFCADDDGGNAIELTAAQAEWATDGKDADDNAELRIAR